MATEKGKYLNSKIGRTMIPDEKEGIREYTDLKKKATGKSKTAISKILPDEKKHLNILKKV